MEGKDKPADLDGKVSTDGAGSRVLGLGLTEHLAAGGDDVASLPDHADHGARVHVGNQSGEEWAGSEVSVVLLEKLLAGLLELECDELEALGLEALDDFPNLVVSLCMETDLQTNPRWTPSGLIIM